jgi:hypothetical protein
MKSVLDAAKTNPQIMDELKSAAKEADEELIQPLFQFVHVGYPARYNWTTQSNSPHRRKTFPCTNDVTGLRKRYLMEDGIRQR